jgi:hypothetical protein
VSLISRQDLAKGLGLTVSQLTCVARRVDHEHYPQFLWVGGRRRLLFVPSGALKRLLRGLYDRWLADLPLSDAVHGRPGRSVVSNAKCHIGRAYVVANDLAECFPSVRPLQVAAALERHGFAADAAGLIMRLCTVRNQLPQGFPTSPVLLNLVLDGLDERLTAAAARRDAVYTRYVDDIVFSGEHELKWVDRTVARAAREHGFRINPQKQRRWGPGEPATITGIVVSTALQPDPTFLQDLCQQLLDAEGNGVTLDVRRVRGRIAWVQALNSELGATLVRRLSRYIAKPARRRVA